MNRQILSEFLGISILTTHIFVLFYLWFVLERHESLFVAELTTPVTVSYFVAITKWFIDNRDIKKKKEEVRISYAVVACLLIGTMLISMPLGIYVYQVNLRVEPNDLNSYFLFVESFFGASFALIIGDLFGKEGGLADVKEKAESKIPRL